MSIDDVTISFQNLSKSEYSSIFEVNLFRLLLSLHRLLGLKITLYVYAQNNGWALADIHEKYKHEFEEASDWLKLGFHAVSEKQHQNNILNEFEDQFLQTRQQIIHFAGSKSLTKIIRLHYWFYPQIYLDVLSKEGVCAILTKEGQNIKTSLDIWETNIRIENCSIVTIVKKIVSHSSKQPLVVFTHEQALNKRTKLKMLIVILLAWLKRYKFVC